MTASRDDRPERRQPPHRAESRQDRAPEAAPWPGLVVAAAVHGITLTPEQSARFDAYRLLLLEWNQKFNLTAITDPEAIERRLFLDALLLAPVLDQLDGGAPGRLVDIGSGAGFPAIPLAIVQPERAITLIEATGKKVSFLEHVVAELGLPEVRAIHARAEDVARQPGERAAYTLATARAVSSLPALIELTMPLLRLGGHAVLPKGLDLTSERAAGDRAAALVGARIVSDEVVPGEATRIVVAIKQRPTADRYPRRAGIPAREPLGSDPAAQPGGPTAGWAGDNGQRRQILSPAHAENAARRRIAG